MKHFLFFASFLLGLGISVSPVSASAPTAPAGNPLAYWFGKNKYDGGGNPHGKWVYYHDEEETIVMRKGRFKHGEQRGGWTYHLADGTLYRKEKFIGGAATRKVKTKLYHPNGQLAIKGTALQYEDHLRIHYYWHGDWHYYAEDGKLEKKVRYNRGNPIETKTTASGEGAK